MSHDDDERSREPTGEVVLTVRTNPDAPLGCSRTEATVECTPEPARVLELVEVAARRLSILAADYHPAAADNVVEKAVG